MPIQVEITTPRITWKSTQPVSKPSSPHLTRESHDHAQIELLITDNPTIHQINRAHLNHDWPTDVITFPLSSPDDPILAGELVVSAEMAKAEARDRNVLRKPSSPSTSSTACSTSAAKMTPPPEATHQMRLRESHHLQAENIRSLGPLF